MNAIYGMHSAFGPNQNPLPGDFDSASEGEKNNGLKRDMNYEKEVDDMVERVMRAGQY
jgi:hypothetical protein